ncbi:hypothetical protein O3597_11220 [Verrucosispora sp. WMMA2044]|nr:MULTISPECIES: hypothetical protein [Micromonospora]WBB50994.1 hypothetical protein O3597_11220 [Verrucosispora sp. WMMA2044]
MSGLIRGGFGGGPTWRREWAVDRRRDPAHARAGAGWDEVIR